MFGDDRGDYGETGDGCGDYGEGAKDTRNCQGQ